MTVYTNEDLTFSAIGLREDLEDTIFQISPTEVPFTGSLESVKASSVTHEWLIDALNAAAANAQIEGDNIDPGSFTARTTITRAVNTTQILSKTASVSISMAGVNKAGRNREFVYQARQRGLEVKRDFEFVCTNNQTPVDQAASSSTTARALRPLCAWYATNDDRGTSGSDGSTSAGATSGTQRALTEDLLKTVIRNVWTAGGKPDTIMVGPFNKQRISTMGGNATRYVEADSRRLIAGIGFYESDFGIMKIVPNRFSRERDCHILDMSYWAKSPLLPLKTVDLARTGDAFNGWVGMESTLVSRNEAASGI